MPCGAADATAPRAEHGRLFPPKDLGLLEAPDRDIWQRPDQIMDALGIAEASVVADIGAGSGWFTVRLARRVGPNGIVYARTCSRKCCTAISRRVTREGLTNVRPVLGQGSDPRLPRRALDAVLIVDAYHEIEDRVTLLRNLAQVAEAAGPDRRRRFQAGRRRARAADGRARAARRSSCRMPRRAGLRLLSQETFLPYQYFLIFGLEREDCAPMTPTAAVRSATSVIADRRDESPHASAALRRRDRP